MDALEDHVPDDLERFCVIVRVMIDPRESDGEESFDVRVCSPLWLHQQVQHEGFVLGIQSLVVAEFIPEHIRKVLTRCIERHGCDSWQDVALKIGRMGKWEFEDLKEG